MEYRGFFAGGVSKHGIEVDQLKSSLQKYVRRGEVIKAVWCARELSYFAELENTGPLMTNVWNRLCVMAVEDVGIGNYLVIPAIEKLRASGEPRLFETAVKHLALSNKAREASHVRAVFLHAVEDEHFRNLPLFAFDKSGDPEQRFKELYSKGEDACFYFFFRAPSMLRLAVWVAKQEKDALKAPLMEILLSWYRRIKNRDQPLFAIQTVLVGLRELDSEAIPIMGFDEVPETLQIDDYCIDKHTKAGRKQGKTRDDFVSEGSKVHNESKLVNALYKEIYQTCRHRVEPEKTSTVKVVKCTAILRQGARSGEQCGCTAKSSDPPRCVRHTSKKGFSPMSTCSTTSAVCGRTVIKSEMFDETVPRGQRMTAAWKKATYLPTEGEHAGKVFKGPWDSDNPKLKTIRSRMETFQRWNCSVLTFDFFEGTDGIYLVSPNLATAPYTEWIITPIDDRFAGSIRVVDRESAGIVCAHNLAEAEQKEILFGPQFLFRDFVLAAILGVGDMGLYNVLVCKGKALIIDYEDNRGKFDFQRIDDIFARGSEKLRRVLTEGCIQAKEKVGKMIAEMDAAFGGDEKWQKLRSVIVGV